MSKHDRGLIKNFTVVIYEDTQKRYLKFKESNKLTHDEALNKLLDKYEEDNHAIKQ